MTRRVTALLTIVLVIGLVAFDMTQTNANPYAAPSIIALGSGVASAGGFCGDLPQ